MLLTLRVGGSLEAFHCHSKWLHIYFQHSLPSLNKSQSNALKKLLEASLIPLESHLTSRRGLNQKLRQGQFFQVDCQLIGKIKMKKMNENYRQKNQATDVLSFPLQESLRHSWDFYAEEIHLGDILICREYVEQQAKEFSITFAKEFIHLFVHGFLHLCGYDHEENDREEKIMFSLEEKLVRNVLDKHN